VLLLLLAGVFVYSSCGRWVFPPSCGVFLPPPLSQDFLLLVAGHVLLLLPSPTWLVYLQFCEGFPSPPFGTLLFLLLITQFLFFSLGEGWSVQGAMLTWPRVVCRSTAYHLSHLVVRVIPSRLGTGIWWQPGALLISPFYVKSVYGF
jgi:hypothetical protein